LSLVFMVHMGAGWGSACYGAGGAYEGAPDGMGCVRGCI
jgi:hypothetical protein